MKQNQSMLRRNSVQALFNGYYYDDTMSGATETEQREKMKKNGIKQDKERDSRDYESLYREESGNQMTKEAASTLALNK